MWAFWVVVALLAACGGAVDGQIGGVDSREEMERVSSGDFDEVVAGSMVQLSCSPQFADWEERGLRLNIPEEVTLGVLDDVFEPGARLPFCLAAQFDGLFFSRFENVFMAVNLVMVDDESQQVFTTGVWSAHPSSPLPGPPEPQENLAEIVQLEYFNGDVLEQLELPVQSAQYTVYATLEEHRSNVVSVRVIVE